MCNFQKNRKYDEYLRFILNRWREIKQMPQGEKRNILLEGYVDRIREARQRLKKITEPLDRIVIVPDPNYPEYYTILYKKQFIFDGTKEEFIALLWDTQALYCTPSQFDCTGQHFTTGYKVGHIGGNRWKVAPQRVLREYYFLVGTRTLVPPM